MVINMFYSAKDLKSVLTQLIINVVIDFVILAAGIAFGYILAMKNELFLGTVVLCVGIFLTIFVLGNFVLPCFYYYRYLMDIFTGKYSKRTGIIAKVGDKPVYKDNKNYYYEIDVDLGNGMCGLFLYDANLGKPNLHEGEQKTLICYENFIIEL